MKNLFIQAEGIRRYYIFIFLIMTFSHISEAQERLLSSDILLEYSAFIKEMMDEFSIPGVAVALVEDNKVVFAKGFGTRDIRAGVPVTPETLFHIGSTNKAMTSMFIATLVDEGLFDWDTPVVKIYEDFAFSDSEATELVTMRHLLSMRSGISDEAENGLDLEEAIAEDIFDLIADTPLVAMPGEEFMYSNMSYAVSGYLGVIATDKIFESLLQGYIRLMQERVLNPIGMKKATFFANLAQNDPNYAVPHMLNEDDEPVAVESEDADGDILAPAGGLKANVSEMARFVATQLSGGIAPNGVRVVSEKNLKETWKPYLEHYAMGWEVQEYQGVTLIQHEGEFDETLSLIGFMPDLKVGFVLFSNCAEAADPLIDDASIVLVELLTKK